MRQIEADRLQEEYLKRIKNSRVKKKIILFEYAVLLIHDMPHLFDWDKINRAIFERYKLRGLGKIRLGAWKIREQWVKAEQKKKVVNPIRW